MIQSLSLVWIVFAALASAASLALVFSSLTGEATRVRVVALNEQTGLPAARRRPAGGAAHAIVDSEELSSGSSEEADDSEGEGSEAEPRRPLRIHRGTRGAGRRVARSGVVACSLEDQLVAIVLCPGWVPTASNLASLQRELLNHHRREGCVLTLANGRVVEVEAGQQLGQVARAVREMTRLSNSVLADELWQNNLENLEDVVHEWENYYRRIDNVAGKVGFWRRVSMALVHRWGEITGSAQRPPLE